MESLSCSIFFFSPGKKTIMIVSEAIGESTCLPVVRGNKQALAWFQEDMVICFQLYFSVVLIFHVI